jgi:hypothetical protein
VLVSGPIPVRDGPDCSALPPGYKLVGLDLAGAAPDCGGVD